MNTLHIAENILKLRHGKRITQEEVAKYLGVTKASVSKWENAQSIPDVMLLPQLAAFFGVTVDELLGYESQLTDNQIEIIYNELMAGFNSGDVKDTFVLANAYIRNHYSCHRFLTRMAGLFITHINFLETREERNAILDQTKKMCLSVLSESVSQKDRRTALSVMCMADLLLSKPDHVIDTLAPLYDADGMLYPDTDLLIQAYQDAGRSEDANSFAQVCMFTNLMNQVSTAIGYLSVNLGNAPVAKETIIRTADLIKVYHVSALNPDLTARFFCVAALFYASVNNATETLRFLDLYSESVDMLFYDGITFSGDKYFDRIDRWISDNLKSDNPRSARLHPDDVLSILDNPAFDIVKQSPEIKKIRERIERAIEKKKP
ncbi:MAG: helix-turn-helix transcriptional regulator [Lachnospiraceae bacterium]|nr:helix-turn-helix transcriptional regulator [Lachnospiraceae bacterium]